MLSWPRAAGLMVVIVSLAVFIWLRPKLGTVLGPVAAYIVVISIMLVGALAVFYSDILPTRVRCLVLCGATLFYISDLFVARDRFVTTELLNRWVGLPVYYTGQFLLALSVNIG